MPKIKKEIKKGIKKIIKNIGVIGAGTMGHGIALTGAKSGYFVAMNDITSEHLIRGMRRIEEFLIKSVEKSKITEEEKKNILARIKITTELGDLKDCDFIIEAVTEDINLKRDLFGKLDIICSRKTIFASNTSTIPIKKIASAIKRADRFIGMHFMNPVPLMRLVEIIKGIKTSEETIKITKGIAETMEKLPVEVNDSPGFVSNRILLPMINEAIYCLQEGVATKEAIDGIMKIGMNHPMGPLETADLIGLDTCYYILEELEKEFSNPKYKPCSLLKTMVKKGYLGRKTGKGFYNYEH